ncbi:hypothetical protein [Dyella sp. 2HG41-7]|uniref:hypothetical protein n=1 Tax=Dyella sp. 2HG41-7 TaxID=2883239 RepID=UPI001F4792DE|nr:hypothetical protein [Dyella sp. 2HG41-7]
MTDAPTMRKVSFYEIYGTPEGDKARLGTGTFQEVFSRDVGAPRIGCFFSHATDVYLRNFVRFGRAHFDERTQNFVSRYGSSLEETGGPFWLVHMSDDLIRTGLAQIPHDLSVPPEGYWIRAILEQQPRLIASAQALAELAGEESSGDSPTIHVLFQGSLAEVIALGDPERH